MRIPELKQPLDFKEVTNLNFDFKLYAEKKGLPLEEALERSLPDKILILTGPEGGFSRAELRTLVDKDFKPLKLSSHILRAETAAIFAVGLLRLKLDAR